MALPLLDDLELALQSPHATGLFLVDVRAGGPAEQAGLAPGDIVTELGGRPTPDMRALFEITGDGGKEPRAMRGVKRGGAPFTVKVPPGRLGMSGYAVTAGACAWRLAPDATDPPDFSAFAKDSSTWVRTIFPEEGPAGYERVHVKRRGDLVVFDHLTFFGGGKAEQQWAFRSNAISTHRLDALLTTTAVDSIRGTKAEGQARTTIRLGDDGTWRGVATSAKGDRTEIEARPRAESALNIFAVPLLALTMPFRAGARRSFPELAESDGTVKARSRLDCLGRFDVAVGGAQVPAWCFAWKHWGEGDSFERFYVSDDRRLVRIEWGPHNGNCFCEAITKADAGRGIPKQIRVE